MSYKATNWDEFIAEIAKSKISSPRLYRTFTLVFSEIGRSKTLEECSEKLLEQPVKTIGEHLREIYKLFDSDYPDLKNQGKGKRQALTECLLKLYETQKVSDNISDRPQPSTNPQNIPTPESIPELTTLEFIGRNRDLINLANLIRQAKIVLVKAGAGVGKSTLAREFLQTRFKKVIRIEMGLESGNVTPAEEKVSQILRKDFNKEPSRDFGINLDILREKLADRANPIGVLIDNLEPALDENYRFREKLRGYDALLAVLGDRDVFSFTLITSRRSLITPRARVHEYSLEGLDITAWRQYFHDCENGADSESLIQMCDAYNGNAKVMDILHGAIKNRFDGNIEAYWNRYKGALLADSELETLISVEMDWLRDNQPDAYKLLCRMGCYRYQDVKTVPFEGLICLLWDVPESQRVGVVDYLTKTSLIEVKGEYYLHPIIREVAKSQLIKNKKDWTITNKKIANFWAESITTVNSISDVIQAIEGCHHYIDISDYISAGKILISRKRHGQETNDVFISLGTLLFQYGVLLGSSLLKIETIINAISPEKPLYAYLHNIIGNHYAISGGAKKAILYHSRCLESANKINIHYLVYASLINLGHHSLLLREPEIALDNLEKICIYANSNILNKSKHEHTHPTAEFESYAYMAFAKSIQGKFSDAARLADLCLNTPKPSKLTNYLEAYTFLYLGKTYITLNDLCKAMYVLTVASHIALKCSFSEVLGIVYILVSKINYEQNYFNESTIFCQLGIEILERISALYELADAYCHFGLIYRAIENYEQAEKYKIKSLDLFNRIEAPKQCEHVEKLFKKPKLV